MAIFFMSVLLGSIVCCWTQTPTQYTMHTPSMSVFESVGEVSICLSRTGDDITSNGFAFLTTEEYSAVDGNGVDEMKDFDALDGYSFEFGPNQKENCIDIVITDDDIGEFKEKFKVTIVGASDGIPGSQPSTEITIEENDFCVEVPVTTLDNAVLFYVTPWDPVDGKPIVFKNTIKLDNQLSLYFSSTDYIPSDLKNVYQLKIEFPGITDPSKLLINRGGDNMFKQESSVLNILTGSEQDTMSIIYDQSLGRFTLTYSNAPDSPLTFTDTGGAPILVKHIFASIPIPPSEGYFTICNSDPINLSNLPDSFAEQSSTSQTYPSAVASRAVDGNRNSIVSGTSCSITDNFEDPWWRVDLGREFDISVVNIFPVADGVFSGVNAEDIAGVEVYVGSCEENYIEQLNWCGEAPAATDIIMGDVLIENSPILTRLPTSVMCTNANTYGRYVYLYLDTPNSMTATLPICEVEVYGTEVPLGSESTVSFLDPLTNVDEAAENVPVTVQLVGPGSTCSTVDVHTEDDTAVAGGSISGQDDYVSIPQTTFSFNPSSKSQEFNVAINPDMVCEEQEVFDIILNNPVNAILGSPSEINMAINDDDTAQYAIENADDGFVIQEKGAPLAITILRTGSADVLEDAGSVLFISEQENMEESITVEFEPDETSKQVFIEAYDDNSYEDDTTFTIRLDTIGQCDMLVDNEQTATVTVEDDDSRSCFDDDDLLEDDTIFLPENTGTYEIRLSREGTLREKTFDIAVQSSNGDYNRAQEGLDFTLSSKSVTFESGEDELFITVTISDDYYKEGDERFDLVLSDPDGITQNVKDPSRITVVISDDDDIYRFHPSYYSVNEGSGTVNVCLERVGPSTRTTTINLDTHDVTAQANLDYRATPGGITVTFFAGLSEACTPITIIGDSVAELTETFLVQIVSDDIEKERNSQATVSIRDDPDVFISFASENYRVNEVDGKVEVFLTKSGDIRQSVSATITSSSITADEDDYETVSDNIRIPPGASTIGYEVRIKDDNDDESDEQFQLILSNAIGGIISDEDTTITIEDSDDQTPEPPSKGLSGGALVGIIAAAVVITIVSALGIGLFCLYLLRRTPTPVVTSSQVPLSMYPDRYPIGPNKMPRNNQPYFAGQTNQPPPYVYNNNYYR